MINTFPPLFRGLGGKMKNRNRNFYDEIRFNRDSLEFYKLLYFYILENVTTKEVNGIDVPDLDYAYVFNKLAYRFNTLDFHIPLLNKIDKLLGIYKSNDYDFKMESYRLAWSYCDNFYHRQSRVRKKINEYLEKYDCSFLTLTFRDSDLKFANDRNLKYHLDKLKVPYIANIDYGGLNGRVHYHVFICSQNIDLSFWPYGANKIKKIIVDEHTSERIGNYITKFTLHSFKETTKVIYSRKKRKKGV